jgi:ABC-2 type transport system permease protein
MNVRSVLVATATGARLVAASSGTVAFMVLIHIVIVSTMGSLWRTAAEANGGSVASYDASALIWYIVATEAAVSGVMGRLIELVGDDIASGAVAAEMLRPAPVVGVRLATELGRTLARISIAFVVGALVALALGAGGPSPAGLALAVPALVLAGLTNVAAQHGFAAIAFWVRDVRSTWFLYQKLVFILGGMLIPLEVLPEGLAHIARFLPFAAMAYVPGRLASGHVEPGLLLVQLAWAGALVGAAAMVFAVGERRVQAVGG